MRNDHHEELSLFHIISVVAQTCVQLKCESIQYRRAECVFDGLNEDSKITSIDVDEQYSKDMCIKAKSFDVLAPGKMWVDGGCRATFKICSIECKFYYLVHCCLWLSLADKGNEHMKMSLSLKRKMLSKIRTNVEHFKPMISNKR